LKHVIVLSGLRHSKNYIIVLHSAHSILEPEIQALVPVLLPLNLVCLIGNALLTAHSIPRSRLALVQPTEVFSLRKEDDQRKGADRDKDLVAAVVVRLIVGTVELCNNV
jgi:hypothetical protein